MTQKGKSRNASCVPFRGRGPRSGEGMYEGKNDYDILILCLIAFRSGGRRLAVRTAMEHPIGALPRTPFPASRDFPSRGNERYGEKNRASYTSCTIPAISPFGGCRHHLARWEACHMTQTANPVTLTSYSSPVRAIPQPSRRRRVKLTNLKNPRAKGPSTLTPAGRVQSGPKNMLDIMSPAHYNSHNLRKQTVEAEIKIIRALTGSRGIEKPAGRRLLNGPLRAR